MDRKPVFNAVRQMLGRGFSQAEVAVLDEAISRLIAFPPAPEICATSIRAVGESGRRLIRKWEGCARRRSDGMIEAYPDPASADGLPWTIGWGATGAGIGPGTVWSEAQCEARFEADLARHAADVARAIGDAPTSENQFDALVSFHYNTGGIASATLTRKHVAGDYAGARAEFGKWIHARRAVVQGLVNRRAEEADLYARL